MKKTKRTPKVFIDEGQLVMDSREVAKFCGIEHDDMLASALFHINISPPSEEAWLRTHCYFWEPSSYPKDVVKPYLHLGWRGVTVFASGIPQIDVQNKLRAAFGLKPLFVE